MLACRRCQGGHIRRSAIRWYDTAGFVVLLRPYRCLSCGMRFRHLVGKPLMIEIGQREYRKRCRQWRRPEHHFGPVSRAS